MGFGQTHGTGPGAFYQLRKITLLQVVTGVSHDGLDGAQGKAAIHGKRVVGSGLHLVDHLAKRLGQTLAAVYLWGR